MDRETGCAGVNKGERVMFKVAGCLLVIYASFMLGHAIGKLQERKVRELSDLVMCMALFKDQMSYGAFELSELIEDCSRRVEGTVKLWLVWLFRYMEEHRDMAFENIWKESVRWFANTSVLDMETIDYLDRLSGVIGGVDTETQIRQLNITEAIIQKKYENENNKVDGIRRLSDSLGILGGVFIVLILL